MPVIDLGKVVGDPGASLRYRGEWSGGSEYFNNASYVDAVTHNGSLWICKTTNTGQTPAEGTYWGLGAQGMAEEILVFSAHSAFPVTGDEGKLYIDNTVNPALMYIWNGSSYVPAGGGGEIEAADVSYDNESSGLTAENIQEAIDESLEIEKVINENQADPYSPDETYVTGRLVIQNNALWKAKQDISVPEPWTPDHWDPTTLAAELSAVNSSMVVQTPGNSIVIETMSIGLGISNNRIYIAVQYPFLINGDYDIAINELGITNVIGGASGAESASVVKQSNSGCQLAYDGEDVVLNQSYFCSQVKLTITFKGHNTSI